MKRWNEYFMDVARRTAQLSYCVKRKVGAVAVRDNRIICVGYNGTPVGDDNACEDMNGSTFSNVLHAEENLVIYAARKGISLEGCTLHVTYEPCLHCLSVIKAAGFTEVRIPHHKDFT